VLSQGYKSKRSPDETSIVRLKLTSKTNSVSLGSTVILSWWGWGCRGEGGLKALVVL
jgi:hypothetical protein